MDIFYSWQSRTPTQYNRNFIQGCLDRAIKNINKSGLKFQQVSVDRDTKGILGTPDIVDAIFQKIVNSSLFVADVTFINSNQPDSNSLHLKKMCNNNVMIELGYAAACLDWENIICVFNSTYGRVEELPFDIRSRRVLTYKLDHSDDADSKKEKKQSLARVFHNIFESFEENNDLERKKILSIYDREGSDFTKLIKFRPKLWGEKLMLKLLIKYSEDINYKVYEVNNNLVFLKPIYMDKEEFWRWARNSITEIRSMTEVLNNLFSHELIGSMSIEDENLALLKFRESIIRITRLISNAVDWEITLRSINCPENMQGIKQSMLNWSRIFINPLNIFIRDIEISINRRLLDQNADPGTIVFRIETDGVFNSFTDEMKITFTRVFKVSEV